MQLHISTTNNLCRGDYHAAHKLRRTLANAHTRPARSHSTQGVAAKLFFFMLIASCCCSPGIWISCDSAIAHLYHRQQNMLVARIFLPEEDLFPRKLLNISYGQERWAVPYLSDLQRAHLTYAFYPFTTKAYFLVT